MEVFDVDAGWLSCLELDLGPASLPRGDALRCGVERLPELDWVVLHILPPRGHGLWFLQAYSPLERSMRRVFFSWHPDHGEDLERRRRFEGLLRKRKIAIKSHKAWLAFGLYPRLWGTRFRPTEVDPRLFKRYQSIAAPAASADALIEHLSAQSAVFGHRAYAPVDDEVLLFNTALPTDGGRHHRLLLHGPSAMTEAEIAEQRAAWSEILGSDGAFEDFLRGMPASLVFAGAIHANANSTLPAASVELLDLRIQFACRLGWPHMLDALREQLMGITGVPSAAQWLKEVDAALATYPVVSDDPLQE